MRIMPIRKDTIQLPQEDLLGECIRILHEGRSVLLKAKGSSMYPFIRDGDTVLLQRCGEVRRGDVVLARTEEGKLVMHRVLAMKGERIALMGDANLRKTELCLRSDIAGTVIAITREGKTRGCATTSERFRAGIWMAMLPLRRILLAVMRKMK